MPRPRAPRDAAHGAVAARDRYEVGGLLQRLLPAVFLRRLVAHLVAGLTHKRDQPPASFRPCFPAPGLWISVTRTLFARLVHMRILVTNDDGVYSPGIAALAQVASRFGEVRIVAPDVEMSSASHSITASRPVTMKRTPLPAVEAYRVNGTPSGLRDARHHALGKGRPRPLGNQYRHATSATRSGIRARSPAPSRPRSSGCAASPSAPRDRDRAAELRDSQAVGGTVLEALLDAPEPYLVNVNFPARRPAARFGHASR